MADENEPADELATVSRRSTKTAAKVRPAKKAAPRKAGSTRKAAATTKVGGAKKAPAKRTGSARKPAPARRGRTAKSAAPVLGSPDEVDDVVEVDQIDEIDEVEGPTEAEDTAASVDTEVLDATAAEPEVVPASLRPPPPAPTADAPARDEKSKGKAKKIVLAVVAVVVLAALLGGGIYWLINRNDEGGIAYTSLKPGDCFNNPPENFKRVVTVPCIGPHDLEVIAVVTDPAPKDTPYPGMDALVKVASERCAPDFQIYVGLPVDQSQLRQVEVVPQESSWKDGSRHLVCTVRSPSGEPLSRPARGSKI